MSVLTSTQPVSTVAVRSEPAQRHRFTVAEFMRIAEQGLFRGRTELVNGEILDMAPQGNAHSLCVNDLYDRLRQHFPDPWFIRSQATHRFTDHDAPEPDLALLRSRPVPGALLDELPALVVEVSDTTLADDLGRKRLDYARFGVGEYWVVDLSRRQVHVFHGPLANATTPEDAYREHAIVAADGEVRPQANSAAAIRIVEILPPAG